MIGFTNQSNYDNISNKLNELLGTDKTYYPSEMAQAVSEIVPKKSNIIESLKKSVHPLWEKNQPLSNGTLDTNVIAMFNGLYNACTIDQITYKDVPSNLTYISIWGMPEHGRVTNAMCAYFTEAPIVIASGAGFDPRQYPGELYGCQIVTESTVTFYTAPTITVVNKSSLSWNWSASPWYGGNGAVYFTNHDIKDSNGNIVYYKNIETTDLLIEWKEDES